jgi:hypothetical protein
VLPKIAQQSQHFSLVRSIGVDPKGLRNHGAAIYMLLTGHDPTNFSPTGLAQPPSRDDLPSIGANVARYRPPLPVRSPMSPCVGRCWKEKRLGLLSRLVCSVPAYDPYRIYDDATRPLRPAGLQLPADVPLERLAARLDLRRTLDQHADELRRRQSTFDSHYDRALSLLQSPQVASAFRLERETETLRNRYGMTRFGQSLLLARRLVEAGTRFIQVTWPARSDDEPVAGPDGSWDTHRNNFTTLREHRCPVFDHSLSGFIEDLAARGIVGANTRGGGRRVWSVAQDRGAYHRQCWAGRT